MGTYNYVPIVNPNIDIKSAIDNADGAYNTAISFLDDLADYIPQTEAVTPSVDFNDIKAPEGAFDTEGLPDAPTRAIDFNPALPEFPNLVEVDASGLSATVPTFSGTAPTIDFITNPGDLSITAPETAPTTDFSFVDPTAPDFTLPTVPTFNDLELPSVPSIKEFNFTKVLPTDTDIQIPGLTFSFTDEEYQSELSSAVTKELLDRVQNGGTGLPVDIENSIWERAKDRENKQQLKTADDILHSSAARGFRRPPGSVVAALDMAAQEAQNKIADLSREIAIKQAELEQSNIQFSIDKAITLEQLLIDNHNQMMNRALDVAKFTQQIAINLYEASVKQFEVKLQAYKVAADVFETQVRAELTKAEVYRAQLEGVKAQVDINDSKVRLYVSQIQGIQQLVEIYKAEWSAVETKVRAEAAKLEGFKSEVDAYTAQVGAYTAKVGAYAERVKAEVAKTNVFDSQVKAYASQVQAYASQIDAGKTLVDADVEINRLNMQHAIAKIDTIVKNTQSQTNIFNAEVAKYQTELQAYSAKIDAESTKVKTLQNIFELQLTQANYQANIELKNADILIQNARNAAELYLEKYKSGAQIGSGLVAASMSGINMSLSESLSASHVETHTYQEK